MKEHTDEEAATPDIDMRGSLVQEEHIVDDTKTDDLRWGPEETLQCSTCSETAVAGCESSTDGANEREELRPEENRSTTVALAERDGK